MAREEKNKDEKVKKKKNHYSLGNMIKRERNLNRSRRLLTAFKTATAGFVLLIILWFLLSGKVNQRSMLDRFIDRGLKISHSIANYIGNLFQEETSPIEISEDGVYLKWLNLLIIWWMLLNPIV